MQIFLILALLIAVVAVIFALQNVTVVTITFFAWNIHTSLAVALLVALGAGILITLLLSIPGAFKNRRNNSAQKKRFFTLEAERNELQRKVDDAVADRDKYLKKAEESEKEISGLEEQLAGISAALQEKEENPGAEVPGSATAAESGPVASTSAEQGSEKPIE